MQGPGTDDVRSTCIVQTMVAAKVAELDARVASLEKTWGTPVAKAAAHCEVAGVRRYQTLSIYLADHNMFCRGCVQM